MNTNFIRSISTASVKNQHNRTASLHGQVHYNSTVVGITSYHKKPKKNFLLQETAAFYASSPSEHTKNAVKVLFDRDRNSAQISRKVRKCKVITFTCDESAPSPSWVILLENYSVDV